MANSLQPLLESRDNQSPVLVASPRLLAEFRHLLQRAVRSKVLVEHARNLVGVPVAMLARRLRPAVLSAERLLAERPMG